MKFANLIILSMSVLFFNFLMGMYYSKNFLKKAEYSKIVTLRELFNKEKIFNASVTVCITLVILDCICLFPVPISIVDLLYMVVFSLKVCLGGVILYIILLMINGKLLFDEEVLEQVKKKMIQVGAVLGLFIAIITLLNNLMF